MVVLCLMTTDLPAATPPSDAATVLRDAGLRVTSPRVATLDVLARSPHRDADGVAREVRERLGTVSTQAVYDVLRALTTAALVRRIEPAGHPARYERRVGDNHHHVVCRACGSLDDVDCATGRAPCLDPVTVSGFVVDEAEVIYWGLCPSCQGSPHHRTPTGEDRR